MAATVRYYDIDRENTDSVSLSAYGSYSSLSAIPSTLSLQFLLDNYDTPNYLSLDGNGIDIKDKNKKFYSAGDYVGCVSANVSDGSRQLENCGVKFSTTVTGSSLSFKKGITFVFYGNCCAKMHVMYRNEDTETFLEEDITVGKEIFNFIPKLGAASLILIFSETVLPYQSIKLSDVKIGNVTVLDKLQGIELLEEINVLSDDLPINSLNFTAVIKDGTEIKSGNPITVQSNQKYYGTFFIDETERISKNIYSVKALNCAKKLDETDFIGTTSFETDISELITRVSNGSGVAIKLCSDFEGSDVVGWLPKCSHRYALCYICWAIGGMVDGSRSAGKLNIRKIPTSITSVIKTSSKRIIGDAIFSRSKVITSAIWEKHNYSEQPTSANKTLFVFSVGTAPEEGYYGEFYFDKPTKINEIYGGNRIVSIQTPGVLGIVMGDGNYEFIGSEYVDNVLQDVVYNSKDTEYNGENIKKFDKFTLYGKSSVASKREEIEKYIESGGTVKAKIRLCNERAGDMIQIETAYDGMITGIITSMNISFGYEDVADIEVLEWQNG